MKKIYSLFIAFILALSLTLLISCGDDNPTPQGPEQNNPSEEFPGGLQGPIVDYEP